ncbi:MAG TPA: hypothetical protein V6C72_17155, partial [Chroococcales cyanobacterium]
MTRSSALEHTGAPSLESPTSAALSAHVYSDLMPQTARGSSGPSELPTHLNFNQDIFGSTPAAQQSVEKQLLGADPSKVSFTTPGQDAKSGKQPDFYLNSEGQLVKNPKATPSKDGSISIEVEGNNSAKKAEQYANQLQKQ